ncbi:discoidin domain-containing protein [Actinopolymorpha alba]|uniref:discoidin domain-containing protein n=1 Tax=Actinopolymorpha alba TaxID=533267 RepID=UPI0003A4C785|nr:discoidin domain-containing protein [Actinopolymorpha alba]
MLDRPLRARARALLAAATALLLCAGVVPATLAPPAVASPASAAGKPRASIVLSSQPAAVELRQCMTETLRVAITNQSGESTFVDLTVTPDAPLWSANTRVSTYVPAGGTVTVPVQIYVPEGAADGEYDVLFGTNAVAPRARLSVPVAVSAPNDRRCVPRSAMAVTASSAQEPENAAEKAIDGATATIWHARYRPDRTYLPQWISFDLGGSYDVAELSYQPRLDGNLNGTITAYTVLASTDGETFTEVVSGTWVGDATRKTVAFNAPGARHIRLLATAGVANYASAAEIVLFGRESDG